MGKIGLIVSAAGILLSGAALFKMKSSGDGEVPKVLYVGVGAVIIGAVLTAFHV